MFCHWLYCKGRENTFRASVPQHHLCEAFVITLNVSYKIMEQIEWGKKYCLSYYYYFYYYFSEIKLKYEHLMVTHK